MIKPNNVFIVNIQKYLQNYAKEETVMGILALTIALGFATKKATVYICMDIIMWFVFFLLRKNTVFVASVLQL